MKKIGYIIEYFPCLTESFILRELEELRRREIPIEIYALRRGELPDGQTVSEFYSYNTHYSPHPFSPKLLLLFILFFMRSPLSVLKTVGFLIWANRSKSDHFLSMLKHLPCAVYFASHVNRSGIDHIHSHFAGIPTSLALMIAKLLSIDFSFTAHAHDLYISPAMSIHKYRQAKFVITCSIFNQEYINALFNGEFSKKIFRLYHGLNVEKYSKTNPESTDQTAITTFLPKNGSTFLILSVGRLEPKKGFPYLIDACSLLVNDGFDLFCCIVGEGREFEALESKIVNLNLQDNIHLAGALPEHQIIQLLKRADIFVLPSIITGSGDHDGLPNVLLESLAMEIPTIVTNIGGIPELIEHNNTGMLVPEKDSPAIKQAIESLYRDKEKREFLAKNGRDKVVKCFNIRENIVPIIELFQQN